MEFVNPFKRREKRDFIPMSIFPASKMTRTSMQIGRAVPIYVIEAIKNNTWRCNINQLTRFMTMDKPVMNDFEVTIGAFFVPEVALDEVTGSNLFARESATAATYAAQYGLKGREFFNPSTPDAQRVKCAMVGTDFVGNVQLVGSLWDHLQYPTYDEVDIFHLSGAGIVTPNTEQSLYYVGWNGIDDLEEVLLSLPRITKESDLFPCLYPSFGFTGDVYTELYHSLGSKTGSIQVMPFDVWCYLNPEFNFKGLKAQVNKLGDYPIPESWYYLTSPMGWNNEVKGTRLNITLFDVTDTDFVSDVKPDVDAFLALWYNGEDSANNLTWSNFYGKYTREMVMDAYWIYVHNSYIVQSGIGTTAKFSLKVWLNYLRIYGDYFLNPLITDKQQFFKYTSAIYCYHQGKAAILDPSDISSCYVEAKSLFGSNANLEFFFDYVEKFECLPVLWQKDFFTAAQIKEAQGGNVTIANGDSIPTLFYKRMFQKFKDLIARMGTDYKTNSDTLYGGNIPDGTLQRSQIIGTKTFTVQVGAIAQTSPNSQEGALAEFAGYAYSHDGTGNFEWTAEENGMIIILAWIRPMYTAITTAVPRHHIKKDYTDYLLPQFGGVGYQDIPQILLNPADVSHLTLKFGIQERYFEYMMLINESSGSFHNVARQYAVDRVVDETTQLGETLSPEFLYITERDDINRIFTDRMADPILASIYFDGTITRQLPAEIRTDF